MQIFLSRVTMPASVSGNRTQRQSFRVARREAKGPLTKAFCSVAEICAQDAACRDPRTALDLDSILRASSCATGSGKRHIPRVAATPASSSSKTGVAFLRKMLPVTSPWISRPGAAPHSFSALDDERRRVIAASPPLAARALQAPWRHGRLSAPSGHRSPWMCLRSC